MTTDERYNREEIRVLSQERNPNFDTKRCSDSCSSSSALAFPSDDSKSGANRMVKVELDAARALVDFKHFALLESGNHCGELGRNWGNRRTRLMERVTSESPVRDEGKNLESSKLKSLDFVKEQSVDYQQQHKKLCKNVPIKPVKDETDSELPRSTHMCSMNHLPFGGGKSKQKLTEAEKEARRLHRILANRESARQTIRRRQAMYKELNGKAAYLELENESWRREKELVMIEYQSLKDKNKHLKEQMARTMKADIEKASEEIQSTHIKFPPVSSAEIPQLLIYNRPMFLPLIWPSIIQSLNPSQALPGPQNTTKHDPMPPNKKSNPNGSKTPFYVLPCPLFFPHPTDSCTSSERQYNIFVGNKHSTGTSSENVENQQPSLSREVETCNSKTTEANLINHPSEASIRFLADRNEECGFLGTHPTCGNGLEQESTSNENSARSVDLENINGVGVHPNKKLVDATAAEKARNRRKEMNRLKNLCN